MNDYQIELGLYQDCLLEIKKRTEIIADHLNGITVEKYAIIEVETICLQFRKILEKIALISLIANKEIYSEQNERFAKHYHAERIMRDLERINPDFYPVPIKRIRHEDKEDELVEIENGYLTKENFVKIYEKCGSMMHAQNPFSSKRPIKEIKDCFPKWLTEICLLLSHHRILLVGGDAMVVALMEREDNGLPQAVLFKKVQR